VQDVNGVFELGNVNHSIDSSVIANADFAYSSANGRHWLPVEGIQPTLDTIELEPRCSLGISRKLSQAFERITAKLYRLHGHYINSCIFGKPALLDPAHREVTGLREAVELVHTWSEAKRIA
jgi:hypothetical protein